MTSQDVSLNSPHAEIALPIKSRAAATVAGRPSLVGTPRGTMILRVQGGGYDGQDLRVLAAKCSIGASEACTIQLIGENIADLHCLILRGSHNNVVRSWARNTRINGHEFVEVALRVGDLLNIGPVQLEVVALEGASADHLQWNELFQRMDGLQRLLDDANVPAAPQPSTPSSATTEDASDSQRCEFEQELAVQRQELQAHCERITAVTEERDRLQDECHRLVSQQPAVVQQESSLAAEKLAETNVELARLNAELATAQAAASDRSAQWNAERDELTDGMDQVRNQLAAEQSEREQERAAALAQSAQLQQQLDSVAAELGDARKTLLVVQEHLELQDALPPRKGSVQDQQQPTEQTAYQEPQYDEPAYEQPAYQEPQYDEPAYEQPAYQEPQNDEPAYEQPAYQEPQNDEPAYEQPAYQEPQNDEPAYEQPAYQEPQYDEPANEQPAYQEPEYGESAYQESLGAESCDVGPGNEEGSAEVYESSSAPEVKPGSLAHDLLSQFMLEDEESETYDLGETVQQPSHSDSPYQEDSPYAEANLASNPYSDTAADVEPSMYGETSYGAQDEPRVPDAERSSYGEESDADDDSVFSRLQAAGIWRDPEDADDPSDEADAYEPTQLPDADEGSYQAFSDAEHSPNDSYESSEEPVEEEASYLGITQTAPSAQAGTGEEEDLDSYMHRLLERSRAPIDGPDQQPLPAKAPARQESVQTSRHEEQSVIAEADYRPRSTAPELTSNLSAMRELANDNADSAIDTFARQNNAEQSSAKIKIAGFLAIVGAVSLVVVSRFVPVVGIGVGLAAVGGAAFVGMQVFMQVAKLKPHGDGDE
jgi:hypothetical protein